jgi:hypothetical protein
MLGDDLRLAVGGSFYHGGELLFGFLKLERLHVEKIRGICPVCPEKVPADRLLNYQYSRILDNRIVTRLRCGRRLKPNLESPRSAAHTPRVSTKQIVQDLLQKLPEDVSLHDVAQEIEFVAAVRQGLAEIDRGERIPIEEIERELPSWVIR